MKRTMVFPPHLRTHSDDEKLNDLQIKPLLEAIVKEKILDYDDSEEIDDCSIDPVWVT